MFRVQGEEAPSAGSKQMLTKCPPCPRYHVGLRVTSRASREQGKCDDHSLGSQSQSPTVRKRPLWKCRGLPQEDTETPKPDWESGRAS